MREFVQMYCDKINACKADIFIIMSRKGTCFFDVLYEDGAIYLDEDQQVISDIALDFPINISPNKKIAILDDIVITGVSIAKIANILIDRGIPEENISIITLACSLDCTPLSFSSSNSDTSPFFCACRIPDEDCAELSNIIASILSAFGNLHDVDFPVYTPFVISEAELQKVLNPNTWNIYNISNSKMFKNEIETIILLPKDEIKSDIWSQLGFSSSNQFAYLKILLHIQKQSLGKVSIQVVPFAIFYEIKYSDIDTLFHQLWNADNEIICTQRLSYRAQLRFCQFALCHKLAKIFFSIAEVCGEPIIQHNVMESLFGYDFAALATDAIEKYAQNQAEIPFSYCHCHEDVDLLDYKLSINRNDEYDNFDDPHIQEVVKDGKELNIQLLYPFYEWYLKNKLPIRQEVSKGYHFRRDREILSQITNRLDSGYSFWALNCIFCDTKQRYKLTDIISLFLDRAIDNGILVPIIYDNKEKGTLCRAFRHGEGLPFGIADRSRIYYFLQQLQKEFEARKCDGIAQVSFEKIIVLFIQMALREGNIFNQFLGFGNTDFLLIRYSVHGAIAAHVNAKRRERDLKFYFDSANYWDWITNYLKKKKIITVANKPSPLSKRMTIVNTYISSEAFREYEDQFKNICDSIKYQIRRYATMFGIWYSQMQARQRNLFKDQVIQLSTCTTQQSIAAAIATEVHYFYRYWHKNVQDAFNAYLQDAEAVEFLEIKHNKITQGLYSGRNKFEWYESSSYKQAISDVESLLSKVNEYIAIDWAEKWRKSAKYEANYEEYELRAKYYECYCCLLVCAACYELLSTGHMTADTPSDNYCEQIDSLYKEYQDVKQVHSVQLDNYEVLFEFCASEIFKIPTIEERIKKSKLKIERFLVDADNIVEDIQVLLNTNSHYVTTTYKSCAVLEFQCVDYEKCTQIIEEAFNSIEESVEKTKLNIFHIGNFKKNKSSRFGIFYESSDKNTQEILDFLNSILSFIQPQTYLNHINSKFVIIPELPTSARFKYKYTTNIQGEIEKFNYNVCDRFLPYLNKNSSSQVLILLPQNGATYEPEYSDGSLWGKELLDERECTTWQMFMNYVAIRLSKTDRAFVELSPNNYIDNSNCLMVISNSGHCTATLVRHGRSIYAITCQHCLSTNSEYLLKLKSNSSYEFYGIPLNMHLENGDNLSAQDEVAILELFWDKECTKNVFFEKGVVLCDSLIDWTTPPSLLTSFGYPNQRRGATLSFTQIKAANDGYYEMLVENGEKVVPGYSGALLIDPDSIPFGILYSEMEETGRDHAYAIPINTVFNQLTSLLKERG